MAANKCPGYPVRFLPPRSREGRRFPKTTTARSGFAWMEEASARGRGDEEREEGGENTVLSRFVRRDGNKEFIFGGHMRGLFRRTSAATPNKGRGLVVRRKTFSVVCLSRCHPVGFSCPGYQSARDRWWKRRLAARDINCYLFPSELSRYRAV